MAFTLTSKNALPLRTLATVMLFLAIWNPTPVSAEEITVAAASDLTFAFKEVASRFEKQTGSSVKLSYGSSGNFFSQIQNGAPYDLFFSADIEYPRKLEAAGFTEPGSIYAYATGKIVLWVPNASKLDLSRGLSVLLDPGIRKIAIANPQHAPYGRAAAAAMQHEGIYDNLKGKLVLGEDISQTAQFVESGNADVGVLALSLAVAPVMRDRGRYLAIPSSDYPAIIQAAVILRWSHNKDLAQQFLKFLKEPGTVALMEQYGFTVPGEVAAGNHQASAPN